MYIMLKDFKHLQTPGRFPNTLIHQIHRTDEVRTWCLISNKINSEKFYIHWQTLFWCVKTNDVS